MSAKIKATMVEIPKTLNIHKIPDIKKRIENLSDESLEILFYGIEEDVEPISQEEVLELINEKDLFKLDEDSKDSLIKVYTSKKILLSAIDDIITPILVGRGSSKDGRAILKKVGQSNYVISFVEEYSYSSKNDYTMLNALKISGVLK